MSNGLRYHGDQPPRVVVFGGVEAGTAIIFVRDNGVGIPPDKLEQIFTPFWRGHRRSGMGLGLSICQRVTEAHGGRLRVESRVDRGSTFRVELPAA